MIPRISKYSELVHAIRARVGDAWFYHQEVADLCQPQVLNGMEGRGLLAKMRVSGQPTSWILTYAGIREAEKEAERCR